MDYVTFLELASEFGIDKSNLRKYVLRMGFQPILIRTPGSKGQATLALSADDADRVRALRSRQGFSKASIVEDTGAGYFYVIQLIPELDPLRVKLGYASDVSSRLSAHQCAAPTAALVKAWPCRKIWEPVAMQSVTRIECTLIGNEVYRCEDLDRLLQRCEEFFAIMPTV